MKTTAHAAATGAREVSLAGRVIRCRCTEAEKAQPDWHARRNEPCPKGEAEDLGVISYWARNPLRRLAWRIGRLARRFRH